MWLKNGDVLLNLALARSIRVVRDTEAAMCAWGVVARFGDEPVAVAVLQMESQAIAIHSLIWSHVADNIKFLDITKEVKSN